MVGRPLSGPVKGPSRGRPVAPATAVARRTAVDERRTRSIEEPLDVRLRTEDPYPTLEVRNPLHGTAYRVLLPEYPSAGSAMCTCTDFARRDLGTCKHIEAGVRWLSTHPDAPPLLPRRRASPPLAGLWREVDRRLARRGGTAEPESLAWRRPGDLLFERTVSRSKTNRHEGKGSPPAPGRVA